MGPTRWWGTYPLQTAVVREGRGAPQVGGLVHYRPQWLGGEGGPYTVGVGPTWWGGPVHYKPQWLGGGGGAPQGGGTCSLQTAVVRGGWAPHGGGGPLTVVVGPTRWWWAPHGVGTCSLQTAVVRGEGVGPTRWGTCSLQTAVVRGGGGGGPHTVGGTVHYKLQWLGGDGPHTVVGDLPTTNRSG